MSRRNDRGLALVLMIIALALAGAMVAVLAGAMGSMDFTTRRMTSAARRRNLEASAAAWAAHSAAAGRLKPGERSLDVDALSIPSAKLKVTIAADGKTIRIDAAYVYTQRPVKCTATRRIR